MRTMEIDDLYDDLFFDSDEVVIPKSVMEALENLNAVIQSREPIGRELGKYALEVEETT